jgi:hypothetical protein
VSARLRATPWFRDVWAEAQEREDWLYIMTVAVGVRGTVDLDKLPDRIIPPRVKYGYGVGDPFAIPLHPDAIPRGLHPAVIPTRELRRARMHFVENRGHTFGFFQNGATPPDSWPR